jgi:hypothetical protein
MVITQAEESIRLRTKNLDALYQSLRSKKAKGLVHPRYTIRGKKCTTVNSYHTHGIGSCYDNKKSRFSNYSRHFSDIAKVEKKITTEKQFLQNKQTELRKYKLQLSQN